MAMMMGSPYEVLLQGATSTDNAKKAAGEVAGYQKQLADVRTDLAMVKGLLGIAVTGIVALVIHTFFV